jgi:hypothetical protein
MFKSLKTRRLLSTLTAALIASGIVTAIALANIEPVSHKVLLTSTNTKLAVSTATVECQYATATGTTASPASKEFSIGAPLFENAGATECSTSLGAPAKVTTKGEWKVKELSATEAEIEVPKEGAIITIPAAGCEIIVAPTAAALIKTTKLTNGVKKTPLAAPTTAEFAGVSVPIKTIGPAPCPSATTSTFGGLFTLADVTTLSEFIKF